MVQIYYADSAGLSEAVLERWLARIDPAKAERICRMRPDDAKASMTGELLLRYGAWQLFGISPTSLQTAEDSLGKPQVISHQGVHFSISHTGTLCLCAVGDVAVGADIQRVVPVRHHRLAERYFTPAELAAYRGAGETEDAFFTLWAKKEAFGKLTGLGLRPAGDKAALPYNVELETEFQNCKVCVLSGT